MAGRGGAAETDALKRNIEDQLTRLVTQLDDLQTFKSDLDAEEHAQWERDTIDQLREFEDQLARTAQGDLTLVDSLGAVQLAIRQAIQGSAKTPEVIRLFARRDTQSLRSRLEQLQVAHRLGKVSADSFAAQACELLEAMRKLDPQNISAQEIAFLESHRAAATSSFDTATTELGSAAKASVINAASAQNERAGGN